MLVVRPLIAGSRRAVATRRNGALALDVPALVCRLRCSGTVGRMRAMFATYWVLIVCGLLLYLVVGLTVE